MMGYTVEEPPDWSALVALDPASDPESESVSESEPESESESPAGVSSPELCPLEQPATAAAPETPAAAMNFRRETLSESRCGSCVITRNRRKEY